MWRRLGAGLHALRRRGWSDRDFFLIRLIPPLPDAIQRYIQLKICRSAAPSRSGAPRRRIIKIYAWRYAAMKANTHCPAGAVIAGKRGAGMHIWRLLAHPIIIFVRGF